MGKALIFVENHRNGRVIIPFVEIITLINNQLQRRCFMLVRPSLAIIREDKVLLLQYNYSGTEVYGLPGGNPEPGETLEQTLVRELKEELNLQIAVENLLLTGEVIFPEKNRATLHCVFSGRITDGVPKLNPAETSALHAAWVDAAIIDQLNLYPNVGRELKELLASGSTAHNPYMGRINQKWF